MNGPLTQKSKQLLCLAVRKLLPYQLHDAVPDDERQAVAIAASKTACTRGVHESQEERRNHDVDDAHVVEERVAKAERRAEPIHNQSHRERRR